jgi:hypothetical protein
MGGALHFTAASNDKMEAGRVVMDDLERSRSTTIAGLERRKEGRIDDSANE